MNCNSPLIGKEVRILGDQDTFYKLVALASAHNGHMFAHLLNKEGRVCEIDLYKVCFETHEYYRIKDS